MEKKKVLVIGAGMGGLSAGSYLAMNGYDVELFEMSRVAGGVCTAWHRGDFTVDLCIHWLVGTGSASSFFDKWNELTPMDDIEVGYLEEYIRMEDLHGNFIRVFSDVNRLEEELLQKAPEDRQKILEMTGAIRKLAHFPIAQSNPRELTNLWERARELVRMFPYMGVFQRFVSISLADYASEFTNPLLQKTIFHLFEPDVPAIFALLTLAWMSEHQAGYPRGGSLPFAQRILDQYVSRGGKVRYESKVTRILVEADRAVGIQLQDGTVVRGDWVVSAGDGHNTLFELLEGKYLTKELETFYEKRHTFPSLVFVALGVARDLKDLPALVQFPLGRSLIIDPETIVDELKVRIHHFDPTLAPPGKTLITINLPTYNFPYWESLQTNEPVRYQSEKMRIAKALIEALEVRFGGIADKVEMIDVATPSTFTHFTNSWKGSFEGWLMTPETGFRNLPHSLPRLKGFFMCGQWVAVGGGLPRVMLSGREVAQLICHADRRPFIPHTAVQDQEQMAETP
jgi:phytoene dehydrogenase-like protein